MRRREFFTLLSSAAASAALPLAARAQPAKTYRIGVLAPANPEPFWSIFRKAMAGLGYVEGRTSSSNSARHKASRSFWRRSPKNWSVSRSM